MSTLGDFTFNEDVVLQHVLACLGPRSLLKVVCINTVFERLACDDLLWLPFIWRLWSNKHVVCTGLVYKPKPRSFPFKKVVLTQSGYKTMKAAELKYILRQRKIIMAGCTEKKDFIELCVASNELSLGGNTLPLCREMRDKWKSSFYMSLRDGKRSKALKEDICMYKWSMEFKSNQSAPAWESSFHPNNTLTSEPSFSRTGELSWCFSGADEYITVGQYPPLLITRLPDWTWKMENQHVIFTRTSQKLN